MTVWSRSSVRLLVTWRRRQTAGSTPSNVILSWWTKPVSCLGSLITSRCEEPFFSIVEHLGRLTQRLERRQAAGADDVRHLEHLRILEALRPGAGELAGQRFERGRRARGQLGQPARMLVGERLRAVGPRARRKAVA